MPDFTHHFCLVVKNDHESYLELQRLVRENRTNEPGKYQPQLRDVLRDWFEDLVGVEPIGASHPSSGDLLKLEMLGCARDAIDWDELARDLVVEAEEA